LHPANFAPVICSPGLCAWKVPGQVVSIAGAVAVTVPIALLGRGHISNDILSWIIILIVVPFAGYGFLTFKDMKFEDFMKAYIMLNFFPQKRVYEDTDMNLFESLNEELIANDILQQRIDNGEIDDDNDEWR